MKLASLFFLVLTTGALVLKPVCFASDAMAENARRPATPVESQVPVELSPTHLPRTFTPSPQVNYDETVIIKAPLPEEAEPQAIPVRRFHWLNIQSKPLNPAQQNR
jgi:hypothetical protein